MNGEDVERVAKAIFLAAIGDDFPVVLMSETWSLENDRYMALARAALSAMPAQGVRVQPLEWHDYEGGSVAESLGFHRRFSVLKSGTIFCENTSSEFESMHDAKAAAQDDYERRILSALEPSQTPAEGNNSDQNENQT